MSNRSVTTRKRVLFEARELWRGGYLTFDSETTGLEWEDQIIQWAVCDQEGNVLGSGNVKPTVPISEGAFEIHGISIEQLANAPSFGDVWPTIHTLLKGKTVVIYNVDFDMGKLWSSAAAHGFEIPYTTFHTECAMHLFTRFHGQVHEYWGTYIWQKLTTAISELGIEVEGQAPEAAHDAAATALVIKKLAELADQELPVGWHPPVNVPCAGCGHGVKECAEANEVWYCQSCSLEREIFHRCPGCIHIVEAPARGFLCDDLCEYCQKALHQEKMLLIGAWHWCPDHRYSYLVETPDLEELCEHCTRQREWKRQQEEADRVRQERIERERKEHRQAYAKAYRQRRKEREQENQRRAAQGLPPLEEPAKPVEAIIHHHGHQFEQRKDQYGRREVYCLTCETSWSKPPQGYCPGIKAYRAWSAIPEHLKTQTALHKLHLAPAPGQPHTAVMEGYYGRYRLYDMQVCVPLQPKARATKKIANS